jgi:thymidylate synthase
MDIHTKTTFEAWAESLKFALEQGTKIVDPDENTSFLEVLNLGATIEEPSHDILRPITLLSNSQNWVYPTLNEINNVILSKEHLPSYKYSYGSRLFNYDGTVDQINDFIIPLLSAKSQSRRAIVNLWNPKKDSSIENEHAPSLMMIDFKIRAGKLHVTSLIRSCDLWFGWPISAYTTYSLQEYVAKKLGVEIGTLTTLSISAHFREDLKEEIQSILKARSNGKQKEH